MIAGQSLCPSRAQLQRGTDLSWKCTPTSARARIGPKMHVSLGEALALSDKRDSNAEGLEQSYDVHNAGGRAAECLAATTRE